MLMRYIDGTAYNSGQRLYNVNRTHVVLASSEKVLHKKFESQIIIFLMCSHFRVHTRIHSDSDTISFLHIFIPHTF